MGFDKDIPESLPRRKKSPWNTNKCKKNGGKDHDMQKVKENKFDYINNEGEKVPGWHWEDWQCYFCGKKKIVNISNPKFRK